MREKSLAKPGLESLNDHQFSKQSDHNDSDKDLGLVTLDQPPQLPASQPPILPPASVATAIADGFQKNEITMGIK